MDKNCSTTTPSLWDVRAAVAGGKLFVCAFNMNLVISAVRLCGCLYYSEPIWE